MRQLIQNLIDNALKFHKEGVPPVVHVTGEVLEGEPPPGTDSRISGRTCRLSVSDNGIGFDPKYRDRIFSIFQKLHGREAYEGTGIGLAICRKIVERFGGAIKVDSSPGEGSTFVITLPVNQPTGGRR